LQALTELAQELSITVAQLSLAWCRQKEFVGSVIFGATSDGATGRKPQVRRYFLDRKQMNERIDEISKEYPYPLGYPWKYATVTLFTVLAGSPLHQWQTRHSHPCILPGKANCSFDPDRWPPPPPQMPAPVAMSTRAAPAA
jgi:hypothetical protein